MEQKPYLQFRSSFLTNSCKTKIFTQNSVFIFPFYFHCYISNKGDKDEKFSFKGLIANFFILNCEINEELHIGFTKKAISQDSYFNFNESYIIPFDKMEDLLTWTPNDPLNVATVPIKNVQRNPVKMLKF